MPNETDKTLAAIRARTRHRDMAIMKTLLDGFTVFPAVDPSDYAKYEIVKPTDPIVCV